MMPKTESSRSATTGGPRQPWESPLPDPFLGSNDASSYSADKFYTASRNKKGFGSTIRLNVPPELLAAVSALVASRRVGDYRTSSDFYRDALVHRLKYLEQALGNDQVFAPGNLAQLIMTAEAFERRAAERENRNRIVRQARENLNNAGDAIERREVLAEIQAEHDRTRDRVLRDELAKFLQ